MDVIKKLEEKAKHISRKIDYNVEYVPGELETEDMYKASFDKLDVCAYGPTKEQALANAQLQAEATLMSKPSLMKD